MVNKQYSLASKVQSKCELLIEDIRVAASEGSFQTKWSDTVDNVVPGKAFLRALASLESDYPFISNQSSTNIYEKHILTFELGSVVRKTGSQTDLYNNRFWFGLAMMFSRSVLYTSEESVPEIEHIVEQDGKHRPAGNDIERQNSIITTEAIKQYSVNRARLLATTKKKLHVDELQTFLPAKGALESYAGSMIKPLTFEARKYKIEVAFSSQRPEHGELFSNNGTLFMILGFVSEEDAIACSQYFDVPIEEVNYYIKNLKLDPKKGINAFVVMRDVTNKNHTEYRQALYIPIPGFEVWNYVNKSDEKLVRKKIQEIFTFNEALLVLTGALPQAGKSPEFVKIENEIRDAGGLDDESDDDQKTEIIAEKLAEKIISNATLYRKIGLEIVGMENI